MSFDLLPHQPKRSRYQIHRFKTYLNCIHHDLSFNVSLLCEVKIIFLPYLCTCDYKKVRHPPLEIIFSIWLTCEDLLLPYSSQRPRLLAIAPRDFSCHRCRVSNWSPVVQPRLHPSVFVSKLHLQREQRSSFHRRDLLLTATAISATKVVDLSSNCRGSQAAFILHQATSLEILVYGYKISRPISYQCYDLFLKISIFLGWWWLGKSSSVCASFFIDMSLFLHKRWWQTPPAPLTSPRRLRFLQDTWNNGQILRSPI